MVGTVIGENEQGSVSAPSPTGVLSVAAETARRGIRQQSLRPVVTTWGKSTPARSMVSAIIGESEPRPDPAPSCSGILSVAAELARDATMRPSFWFAAALAAGVLSVGLAAWEGGAIHGRIAV
jgi:hypothetical protein